MRVMALDIGESRIGVALSDPLKITARGLSSLKSKSYSEDVKLIKRLAEENDVKELIVGLPRNMNGTLGPQARRILKFVDLLRKNVPVEVKLWDERLSTVAAEKTLLEANISRIKRKRVIDKLAAVVILQGYLDFVNKQ